MLILSRRPGEALIIGEDIRVRILEIVGGKVKIGIAAPDDIEVDREEVRVDKESKRLDRTARDSV